MIRSTSTCVGIAYQLILGGALTGAKASVLARSADRAARDLRLLSLKGGLGEYGEAGRTVY